MVEHERAGARRLDNMQEYDESVHAVSEYYRAKRTCGMVLSKNEETDVVRGW